MWFKRSRRLGWLSGSTAASGYPALEWLNVLIFPCFMKKRPWVQMGRMTIKYTVCKELSGEGGIKNDGENYRT